MFHSLVIVPGHVYKDLWTSLGSPSFSLLGLPLLPPHCPLSFTLYTYISIYLSLSISISLRVLLAEPLLVWPCPLGLVLPCQKTEAALTTSHQLHLGSCPKLELIWSFPT